MAHADRDRPPPAVPFAPGLLVLSLALCFAAAAIGSAATMPAIGGWYAGLEKPSFNPPNWIFGPVWTVLYAAMALVLWQILKARPADPARRRRAMAAFATQLVLNALWSIAFFGLNSTLGGLVVIVPLWAAILWTYLEARPVVGAWALLLLPYLAWVSFAALLNLSIHLLN
jgi:benzodiazapine receptor